jgi:hypothetical protein
MVVLAILTVLGSSIILASCSRRRMESVGSIGSTGSVGTVSSIDFGLDFETWANASAADTDMICEAWLAEK